MSKKMSLSFFIVLLSLFSVNTVRGEISKRELSEVASAIERTFPELTIVINPLSAGEHFWWNLEDKYASYSGHTDQAGKTTHYIYFFGGLARMIEMDREGAALIICHELGHGIGGPPYKKDSKSSVEGQADYFATRFCLPKVLNLLPSEGPQSDDPLGVCQSENCRRMFKGMRAEIAVMRFHLPKESADFGQRDLHVAESIDTSPFFYPSNQCRLDTLVAGAQGLERPLCWWVP